MILALPLPLLLLAVAASSVPEDIHAFPRYSVLFLNGLPIDNNTAHIWLATGLTGGLNQFLGRSPNSIDSGPTDTSGDVDDGDRSSQVTGHDALQFMRMGKDKAFLCYIPPPLPPPPPLTEESQQVAPASKTWQLLSALAGTCLYHRQGWFTYSYCHNEHVRQFRELAPSQPGAVGQVPEEDSEWESFTLGRSPTAELNNELVATDETANAQNLEVARDARQRYLVQRWGEGTICDKTGRPREIEVQFHCSTTTADTIMLVKEMSTCKYALVIHTPRLCAEPGFKSRAEHTADAPIRCREIVDDISHVDPSTPFEESSHPRRRAIRPAIAATRAGGEDEDEQPVKKPPVEKKMGTAPDEATASVIRKFLEGLLGSNKERVDDVSVTVEEGEGGEKYYIIEGDEDIMAKFTSAPKETVVDLDDSEESDKPQTKRTGRNTDEDL